MGFARIILAAALGLAALGCAEEAQTLQSAEAPSRSDSWQDQHRERTLRQDESQRIYH